MKALVTGGSGFIGGYVCRRLAEVGHTPVVYDRQRRPNPEWETILGDTRDEVAVTEAVAHVDAVIHLAGVLGTQETIRNPHPAAETNILGGLNVFSAVAQYGLPAVYIAVGNHWMDNTYSITKTCAERFAHMFNREHGTHIAVVRALNAYGPGQQAPAPWGPSKVRKIMPSFICRTLAGQPIEIYGDGTQIMDMIYVEDTADVLVRALNPDIPTGITYEAGTGRHTTVRQIAELVVETVGRGDIVHIPMRPGEPPQSIVVADPDTLAPLGVNPYTFLPLEEGVKHTVEHFASIF